MSWQNRTPRSRRPTATEGQTAMFGDNGHGGVVVLRPAPTHHSHLILHSSALIALRETCHLRDVFRVYNDEAKSPAKVMILEEDLCSLLSYKRKEPMDPETLRMLMREIGAVGDVVRPMPRESFVADEREHKIRQHEYDQNIARGYVNRACGEHKVFLPFKGIGYEQDDFRDFLLQIGKGKIELITRDQLQEKLGIQEGRFAPTTRVGAITKAGIMGGWLPEIETLQLRAQVDLMQPERLIEGIDAADAVKAKAS